MAPDNPDQKKWVNPAPHPIIYVRGYAMTRGEIDLTTADPFCGFNIGSTIFRATTDRTQPPRKFMFESPVLRLSKDFEYGDVFLDGADLSELPSSDQGIPRRSIVIHRYYDSSSSLLGDGKTKPITEFAEKLSELIRRVQKLTATGDDEVKETDFRCYLVAHSMGGLVCRAFLQNPKCDTFDTRKYVDKFFTYATPHNGIDMAGINVPTWLTANDISNFNREKMADYLALSEQQFYKDQDEDSKRVDWISLKSFASPPKIFCLVGTNRTDYEPAMGLSRTFAGHGSDGLVRIENAIVCSSDGDADTHPTAKAFVYRSHSGYFGIVNSEEGFQNLTRFLFGDLRIDIWLDIETLELPDAVVKEANGKNIDALYQVEVLAAPRGKPWYLTRRVAEEDSVACLRHENWVKDPGKYGKIHLSTAFLSTKFKTDKTDKTDTLSYIVTIGVKVPDYEVDGAFWTKHHYEGSYLFHGSVLVSVTPPGDGRGWQVKYDWQTDTVHEPTTKLDRDAPENDSAVLRHADDGSSILSIDLPPRPREVTPAVTGQLRFVISEWNK